MSLREALDRTLLLMRDEISDSASDQELLFALADTSVVLVADEANLSFHSAQTAYVTAAMLLARSGHKVYLAAPNVELLRAQPPLAAGKLIDQLNLVGQALLPGFSFGRDAPHGVAELAVLLGDTIWSGAAVRQIRLNATSWQARMTPAELSKPWAADDWPLGAMGAAALATAEAFKTAMNRLAFAARDPKHFGELFAPTAGAYIDLAPRGTPEVSSLRQLDFISGGAISSCALYALLRLPRLEGVARVIEHDTVALSNLNRGMLFLRSSCTTLKSEVLAGYSTATFPIISAPFQFDQRAFAKLGHLTDAVLVGVDDIKARWNVQRAWPRWLGVGATTHFSAMASFHTLSTPCAGCLHPRDDDAEGPIPTVAFVSFWSGLWLVAYYLRHLVEDQRAELEQQIYFSPLRPENVWRSRVQRHPNCPVECGERASASKDAKLS